MCLAGGRLDAEGGPVFDDALKADRPVGFRYFPRLSDHQAYTRLEHYLLREAVRAHRLARDMQQEFRAVLTRKAVNDLELLQAVVSSHEPLRQYAAALFVDGDPAGGRSCRSDGFAEALAQVGQIVAVVYDVTKVP